MDNIFEGADKKFSFSFWTYFSNLTANQIFFSKLGFGPHSEDQRQFFVIALTDGTLRFRTYFDLLGTSERTYNSPISTLTTGAWQLVRVTYDGSLDTNDGADRVTMRVDDVNKAISMTGAGALGDMPSGIARLATGGAIGSSGSIVSNEMTGFIDQGDIWSKRLTSQDDTDLWNGGAGVEVGAVGGVGALINGGLINNGLTRERLVH